MIFQVRTNVRALAAAISCGSLLGLAVGAAYLAGLSARTAAEPPSEVRIALVPPAVVRVRMTDPILVGSDARRTPTLVRDRFRLLSPKGEHSQSAQCLARAVYYEARGEAPSGQAAVAQVVLNRVHDPAFPKTVCGVVYQRSARGCQFTFACDASVGRSIDQGAWLRARSTAERALNGRVSAAVGDATQFHAVRSGGDLTAGFLKVAQIGAHVFYRISGRGSAGDPSRHVGAPTSSLTLDGAAKAQLRPALASFAPLLTIFSSPQLAAPGSAKPADASTDAPHDAGNAAPAAAS